VEEKDQLEPAKFKFSWKTTNKMEMVALGNSITPCFQLFFMHKIAGV